MSELNAEDAVARVLAGADIPLLLAEAAMWRYAMTVAAYDMRREQEDGGAADNETSRGIVRWLLTAIMTVGSAVARRKGHVPIAELLRGVVTDDAMTAIGLHIDALLLPYRRRIASWTIRTDIWQAAAQTTSAKDADSRTEATASARKALPELDAQLFNLGDINFPEAMKSKLLDAELVKLKASYGAIRQILVGLAA